MSRYRPRSRRARDRAALPHALRRGLRHLAVRRGVAAGGDRVLLPAAAARARAARPSAASERRGDGRRDARAGRPARACRSSGERFLRFMREVRRDCHRQDAEGLDAAGRQADAASLRRSARRLRVGGRRLRAPRRRPARGAAAPARRRRDRAVGVGRDPCRAAAARHRAGRAPAGRDRHRRAPRVASARGAAGSGCPSAPTGRASRSRLRPPACARSAWTRPAAATRSTSSSRSPRAATVAMPIDWQTIALVWDEHGYPADPAYRDYHAQTVNGMRAWTNGGAPYDHDAAAARAREHARGLRRPRDRAGRRIPGRPRAARAGRLRARHRAARALVVRGAAVAGGGVRAGRRARGLALTTLPAALERHEPVERAARRVVVGRSRRTCAPGTRRAVADHRLGRAAGRARPGRGARASPKPNVSPGARSCARAPRGSCLRSSPATGRS